MGFCASKEPVHTSNVDTGKNNTQAKRQDQSQALTQPPANQTSSTSSSDLDQQKALEKPPPSDNTVATTSTTPVATSNGDDKEVKVLLLGSGESGKSTIVKQMKIIHQNGFSKEDLYEYKPFVYRNILDCIKSVITAIMDLEPQLIKQQPDVPQVTVESEDDGKDSNDSQTSLEHYNGEKSLGRKHILDLASLNQILDYEFSMNTEEIFDADIASKIKEIYNTPEVQTFVKYQQGNFYLIDSTHYFLSDIDRLVAPDYIPSQQDILRTRKKTSGIYDFKFQMSTGLNIHMYDVGGQRSERKKWIHCFDNVTLIIFCVALSEYDQVLLEENSQNRLEESLTLFDSVVNSRWFARTSIVLFLNKIDVFADKLPYSPLENYFPDYNGGNNINKAAKYILWRFTQVNRSGLNIYPHVTQATDTSNIQLVFAAVKETILENSLRDSGLL